MDGVQTIHADVLARAPQLAAGDRDFTARACVAYGSYLRLSAASSEILAPGPAIDLVWHAHQCTPEAYAAAMAELPRFVDHVPCGEANPPEPGWLRSTKAEWARLLDAELDAELFAGPVACCCCCAGSGGGQSKAERLREQSEEKAVKAVRRLAADEAAVKSAQQPIAAKFAAGGVRVGRDGLTLGERVEAALAAEAAGGTAKRAGGKSITPVDGARASGGSALARGAAGTVAAGGGLKRKQSQIDALRAKLAKLEGQS